jgi:hypothetical protein
MSATRDDDASAEVSPTDDARTLLGRGVSIAMAQRKLNKQHRYMTFASVAVLVLALVALVGWGLTLIQLQGAIPQWHRCVFWRMFAFPAAALAIGLRYALHLIHDNGIADLNVGGWIALAWALLQLLYGIWLSVEAFWWCPSHLYDYCTNTVVDTLTTGYWIFIISNWALILAAFWVYFIVRASAKWVAVATNLYSGLTEGELQAQQIELARGHRSNLRSIGRKAD